jgi:hypothetical protein
VLASDGSSLASCAEVPSQTPQHTTPPDTPPRSKPAGAQAFSLRELLREHRYCRVPSPSRARIGTWQGPFTANGRECHTIFPSPTTVPRHIPCRPIPAWQTRTTRTRDNPPTPTRRRTRTRRRRCSPPTPTRRRRVRATMNPIEGRRKTQTCRCRRSTCPRYAWATTNPSRRRNLTQDSNPWAHRCLHHSTRCRSTTSTRVTRRKDSP